MVDNDNVIVMVHVEFMVLLVTNDDMTMFIMVAIVSNMADYSVNPLKCHYT